jgi:hypothetical protein
MKLTVIEELKKAKPKKRLDILQKIHDRNIAFFKARAPELGQALENMGTGGFVVNFTADFLDVYEQSSGEYAHPPGQLLEYIEKVGGWHHTGWIDKLEPTHVYTGEHEHGRLQKQFYEALHQVLPQINERMASGEIQLPRLDDGRRFSGSTVFLGALTGLHIVHYLNTTEVRDIFIVEPDVNKFALSCWFLDYSAIEKRFGRLVLHVGEDMPESPLDFLMNTSPVGAGIWLRILPVYPSAYFDEIVARINLRWRAIHEIMVPFDRELRNLGYGAANLRAERPILAKVPQLSKNARIAVVGSGPSLENDIPWLKANRSKLIVFAVHSSVRVLRKHGIKADFQVTLDTELLPHLPKLQLDTDVPLICYYKIDPKAIEGFDTVLMMHESGKADVVRFNLAVSHTHPTSGNTALAAALYMQAAETYLLGLDLGFREAEKSHAAGSWYDDAGGAGHADAKWRDQVRTRANFEDSEGAILTHAYYNYSRHAMERAIEALAGGRKVYNLSDGAYIEGAEPRRSADITLPVNRSRKKDLQAIQDAFVQGNADVWEPYERSGAELLKELRERLLKELTLKHPSWLAYVEKLDTVWEAVFYQQAREGNGDIRMEIYSALVQDLFRDWLRVQVFTRSPAQFALGYSSGLSEMKKALDELVWSPDLDFPDGAGSEEKIEASSSK